LHTPHRVPPVWVSKNLGRNATLFLHGGFIFEQLNPHFSASQYDFSFQFLILHFHVIYTDEITGKLERG